MCNIAIETIKHFIDVSSALLTPVITFCTFFILCQQKNIQHKQQQIELLKLRIEHMRAMFDTWGNFHQDIHYIKGYEAKIIVPNGITEEDVIFPMEKVRAELMEHNFSTKYLFTEDIYKLENDLIESLGKFIPSRGTPFSIYHLSIEEYTKNREMFNNLYKKYEKIMDKESRICN